MDDEAEEDQGPSEYIVETIHDVRYVSRRLEYLVEWEDFPEQEHFTWEPTKHLPSRVLKSLRMHGWQKVVMCGYVWPGRK